MHLTYITGIYKELLTKISKANNIPKLKKVHKHFIKGMKMSISMRKMLIITCYHEDAK